MSLLLGLAVGSFVNVVIHRVPRRASVVAPGSHCTACGAPIKPQDNIPIVSFVLLGGKCRACGAPISWQYPVVEVIVAGLFWLTWWKDGLEWTLLFDWGFVATCVALAWIDLEHRILPDVITYPSFVMAVGARGLVPQSTSVPWWPLSESVELAVAAGLIAGSGVIMLGIEWLDYLLIGRQPDDSDEWPADEAEPEGPPSEAAAAEPAPPPDDAASDIPPENGNGQPAAFGFLARADEYGKYLPHVTIVLGLALAGIFLVKLMAASPRALDITFHVRSVTGAVAGAAVGGGILWVLRVLYYAARKIEGVGFGDIKMMMVVGAYLGGPLGFLAILGGSLLGSVVGMAIVVKQRTRSVKIPFGLFLAIGAVLSLLIGQRVIEYYWSFYRM
jgi:leader peptidase (prepilin peptidase)/N-methyltransferase